MGLPHPVEEERHSWLATIFGCFGTRFRTKEDLDGLPISDSRYPGSLSTVATLASIQYPDSISRILGAAEYYRVYVISDF